MVDNVFQRLFPNRSQASAPAGDDQRRELKAQLEAVDLIGERARLNELISGGTDSKLFSKIERTMNNLQSLSSAGSPIADRRGHELFSDLTSAAVDAVLKEVSIPAAMSPILMSKGALEAYFSLSSALQTYLFDYLFSRYAHAIDQAREALKLPMGGSGGYGDFKNAVDYCLARMGDKSMSDKSLNDFLDRVKMMQEDPGFLRAYLKLADMRSELDMNFRGAFERFAAFQKDFSDFVMSIYGSDGIEDEGVRAMWRYAFSEVDDLLRDADNVLTSIDVTFALFARYESREKFEIATEVLKAYGISSVYSAIDLAVKLNNVRADARNTRLLFESLPDLDIPSYLRVDLFRVVNELILNAFRYSDLSKSRRTVKVSADLVDGLLKIKVKDNGPGLSNIAGRMAPTERGGLARVDRIVKRRGWRFSMKSRAGKGTTAKVLIGTESWKSLPASATGSKHTVPPPGGFEGIARDYAREDLKCAEIDPADLPADIYVTPGAYVDAQLRGLITLSSANIMLATIG